MCMVNAWRPEDVCPALPFCFYSFESGPLTEAGAAPVILLSPPPSVLSLQVHITMPDFLCGCQGSDLRSLRLLGSCSHPLSCISTHGSQMLLGKCPARCLASSLSSLLCALCECSRYQHRDDGDGLLGYVTSVSELRIIMWPNPSLEYVMLQSEGNPRYLGFIVTWKKHIRKAFLSLFNVQMLIVFSTAQNLQSSNQEWNPLLFHQLLMLTVLMMLKSGIWIFHFEL